MIRNRSIPTNKLLDFAYKTNNLTLIKNILDNNINYSYTNIYEKAFCMACFYGNLDIAKWLVSYYPLLDISAKNEYALRLACEYGHLEMAQWLVSYKPLLDISAANEYAFRWSCFNGHLNVAKWLYSLNPKRYFLQISDNDKIINYRVLEPCKLEKILKTDQNIKFEENCMICIDTLSQIKTNCGHMFCKSCLSKYMNDYNKLDCPGCRQQITECYC